MAKQPPPKRVIKKVSPYPISASLTGEAGNFPVKIQKVTSRGALIEIKEVMLKLKQEFQISFTLPVFNSDFYLKTRVVRFLDVVKTGGEEKLVEVSQSSIEIQHLAELHFLDIDESRKKAIRKFCLQINQDEV